jgi:hypothetical protein
MRKKWYRSMTFWGALLLFLGGGLEALGFSGVISALSGVLGVPLTAFGLRRALK